ncbi:MAG TPA: hypothetical protein VG123_10265 [Streptosporangiaceae bacterium]|nr:hypothetical protein [Streptosporangiaceae bacterium]
MPHHDALSGACDPPAPSIGGGPRAPFGHATPGPDPSPGPRSSPGPHSPGPHSTPGLPGSRDPELAAILPVITGPGGQFRHRQHINLAYYAVRRYGMPDAIGTICAWIRQIAAYERAPQKYHHTVSRAWVEAVAYHVAEDPGCDDFEDFAARNPALLDKRLLGRHYRSATLAATAARSGWVEPDLAPFPWSAG